MSSNGTILFVRSPLSNWDTMWPFWGHVMQITWPKKSSALHWHYHWHPVMPIASSMTPLHLLSQDNQNEVQNSTFFWHYMMPMVSKLAPLYCLGQDNWNEVGISFFGYWHQCLCHMMLTILSMVPLHVLGQDNWN